MANHLCQQAKKTIVKQAIRLVMVVARVSGTDSIRWQGDILRSSVKYDAFLTDNSGNAELLEIKKNYLFGI